MNRILNISDVWKVEQEILDVFHTVCVENNLKYSLGYGTLLGAVRHGGFIPWDDDIDVIMPREDYNKLRDVWNESVPDKYIFQDYYTDENYINNFAKIRKNNTTFLQSETEKNFDYHKGIFIDIFPADRVPNNTILRKIQIINVAFNLLYSHRYTSGNGGILGIVEKILLKCSNAAKVKRRNKSERKICKYNNNKNLQLFFSGSLPDCRMVYDKDLFENLCYIEFNGKQYYAVKDYKKYLKCTFGDFMKLPPKEEQVWKHHPILIDFEHNFEDICL